MRPITALTTRLLRTGALALLPLLLAMPAAQAQQGQFAPAAIVNDRVITNYDVTQRARLLDVLDVRGDLQAEALDRLIDERVQRAEAERRGVQLDDTAITEGVAEFAARFDRSPEAFLDGLAQSGVSQEHFRDFIEIGLMWRQLVRARFQGRVNVTDADVDNAMDLSSQRGAMRVLMSELFLPSDAQYAEAVAEIAPQIAQITSFEAFADAARRFSAAPSRERGGRLDWMPLSNLPPQLRGRLLDLSPGQVAGPIEVPGAIGFFQLRALESADDVAPSEVRVEYARLMIPGGRGEAAREEAARLAREADICTDLFALTGQPTEDRLRIESATMAEVPTDIGVELAKLDPYETSATLTRGDDLMMLMLCSREMVTDQPPQRERVREQLLNQRLGSLADGFLAELRAAAYIRRP